jgi:hypothetical protein
MGFKETILANVLRKWNALIAKGEVDECNRA